MKKLLEPNITESTLAAYLLRRWSLEATTKAGSGHPTSCLSTADLVAVLFTKFLHYDIRNPREILNDSCIFSKGHAAPLLYAAWHLVGAITREELMTLRAFESRLEGHPTPHLPFVPAATGSLGQGLAIAGGEAWVCRYRNVLARQFVLLGDAELDEGSVWEAAGWIARENLSQVIALVDVNGLGQATPSSAHEDICVAADRWRGFGWQVQVIDGHDHAAIHEALDSACGVRGGAPQAIVARTVKGYGLPSVAGKMGYHGKAFTAQELPGLLKELQQAFPEAAARVDQGEIMHFACKLPHAQKSPAAQRSLQGPLTHGLAGDNEEQATREAAGIAVATQVVQHEQLVVIDGDVANSTHMEYAQKVSPQQFIECGVAEQTMIGVGTGVAARGMVPVISTFGAFFTRAADQLRMAAIGGSPLKLIGTHAGVSIGADGPSQMALEDIALMRALPGSIVLSPADATSAYALTTLSLEARAGIVYVRTMRQKSRTIYPVGTQFMLGGCHVVRSPERPVACCIVSGATVAEMLTAADVLMRENIPVTVIDCYSIKPLAESIVRAAIKRAQGRVLVAEDHYVAGGLGDAVVAACVGDISRYIHCAVPSVPPAGSGEELRRWAGIDAASLAKIVREKLVY